MTHANPSTSGIRDRLTYRRPSDEAQAQCAAVRGDIIELGERLEAFCPPGRALSLALTKLEETASWAFAAIVRNSHETEVAA